MVSGGFLHRENACLTTCAMARESCQLGAFSPERQQSITVRDVKVCCLISSLYHSKARTYNLIPAQISVNKIEKESEVAKQQKIMN